MGKIELLPHNEVGYNKLINKLKENDFVSINHATGTGKSFIILKYLYNNKEKKILFLSSNYPIIDQLVNEHMPELNIDKDSFSCLDTEIYSNLIRMDMKELADKYDIIVLDEYHRCGR